MHTYYSTVSVDARYLFYDDVLDTICGSLRDALPWRGIDTLEPEDAKGWRAQMSPDKEIAKSLVLIQMNIYRISIFLTPLGTTSP